MAVKLSKKLQITLTTVIIIGIVFAIWQLLLRPSNKKNLSETAATLEINKKNYNAIMNPPAREAKPAEPGYGREDPFVPYK